jgi:hypothetical protein
MCYAGASARSSSQSTWLFRFRVVVGSSPTGRYMNARHQLASSLTRRVPTWGVAQSIISLGIRTPELESLASSPSWQGGFNDDFDRPTPATKQVRTFMTLFGMTVSVDTTDPLAMRGLVRQGLVMTLGEESIQYRSAGDALVARAWRTASQRKRLRFLRRLEQKADRLEDSWRLRHAQMQAKSRLAYLINSDACDTPTLAFCAYLAARANRRSQFVLGPQSRAMDAAADELMRGIKKNPDTNWDQVALMAPIPSVLERCSPEWRGRLIGTFHAAMADAAAALADLYVTLPERMRAEMVMVKGVDSSRWNAYAGAFNTMRSAWLDATLACGLDTREEYLPGKAPRLMASDLVWWYRNSGQDLHEDTTLFSALPKPWDVILGKAQLDRSHIEIKASDLGVDVSTGWTGPRKGEAPERTEPEPALVHGIAISDPLLAVTLRRCRVFSGRDLRHVEDLPEAIERIPVFNGRRLAQPVVGAVEHAETAR